MFNIFLWAFISTEGRSQKKKKKKRFFKVDLNLANVEADLLLVDRLYYKLATIHVLALLLSFCHHLAAMRFEKTVTKLFGGLRI